VQPIVRAGGYMECKKCQGGLALRATGLISRTTPLQEIFRPCYRVIRTGRASGIAATLTARRRARNTGRSSRRYDNGVGNATTTNVRVISRACPLARPFDRRGMLDYDVTDRVLSVILSPWLAE